MSVLLTLSICLAADFILFHFLGTIVGIIGLTLTIIYALNVFGFLRSPSMFRGSFVEGTAFLKDYQGSYSNNRAAFEEAEKIIKTFKLNEEKDKYKYGLIGIFYDRPGEVEESKLRCSIGIYKRNQGFPEKPPRELESYCTENNYYYAELPTATSLYGEWKYPTFFTLTMGIKKFYAKLKESIKDTSFLRNYRLNSNMKFDIIIQLYESDSKVSFYVPYFNVDKFRLFKGDKKSN